MELPLARRRPVYYLAPAILVLVASVQLYRAHVHQQSPWAGAGFGMFAVIDGHDQRFVRLYLTTPHGEEPIALPRGVEEEELAVRVVPSGRNLGVLARRAFAIVQSERPDARGIRVEAAGIEFAHSPPRARAVSLGEFRVTP